MAGHEPGSSGPLPCERAPASASAPLDPEIDVTKRGDERRARRKRSEQARRSRGDDAVGQPQFCTVRTAKGQTHGCAGPLSSTAWNERARPGPAPSVQSTRLSTRLREEV